MKRTLTLLALMLALTGLTTAQGDLQVSDVDLPENINAGSSYEDTVKVTYDGSTSIAAELVLDIEAENTNTEGISFKSNPSEFVVDPGENSEVSVLLETSQNLKPDNFTYTIKAQSEVEKIDSGGGSSGGGTTIIDEGPEYNQSKLNVVGDLVEDGELNQTELERIDNLFEEASDVMDELRDQNSELKKEKRNDTIQISELKQENAELRQKVERLNESSGSSPDLGGNPLPKTPADGIIGMVKSLVGLTLPFL